MRTFIILACIFSVISAGSVFAQTYQDFFAQGDQAFLAGDFETAATLYEKSLELNQNFAPTYNQLGLTYKELGLDIKEVAWCFKAAVDIDPDHEEALINLGKAYYTMGNFDLAEHYTLKALKMNPESPEARLSLGWIYLLGKSRPKDALFYFKGLAERWRHPSAYFGLGMAYFMSGDSARVLECITALREINEDNLAIQLENIIRGNEYARQEAPPADESLLEESYPGVAPGYPGSGTSTVTMTPYLGPQQISVSGTIPVRLKGKFYDLPPEEEAQEKKSGVLKK